MPVAVLNQAYNAGWVGLHVAQIMDAAVSDGSPECGIRLESHA